MRPLIMCAWLVHKKRGYVDLCHSPAQLLEIGRNPPIQATRPRKVFTQLYLPRSKELDEDIAAGNGRVEGRRVQLHRELFLRLLAGGVLLLGGIGAVQQGRYQHTA